MALPEWFNAYARDFFERYLKQSAGRPFHALQIGAFSGDASLWLLQNVLTASSSSLVDVDTWEGSGEHDDLNFAAVEQVYDERRTAFNAASLNERWEKFKGTSDRYFRWTSLGDSSLDFVYIDGDHRAPTVLSDAVHALPLLKVGGLLAFDDYAWHSREGRLGDPGPAVDAFRDIYSERLETLDLGAQAWFRKIA